MRWSWLPIALSVLLVVGTLGPAPTPVLVAAPTGQDSIGQLPTPEPHSPPRSKREGRRIHAHEWFYGHRAAPFEHVPDNALLRARQQLDAGVAAGTMARAAQGLVSGQGGVTEGTWTAIGPRPIGSEQGGFSIGEGQPPNSGRITSVVVDPSDANTVYIGAADGGVWKTTNGGTSWTPMTDTQPSLAIGALAIDPSNRNIVYAGLGEQNNSSASYFGMGILKSTNAGSTWTLLNDPIFDRQRFGRIAVDPNNSNTVYAATRAGIVRSDNGGTSWAAACLATGCFVTDVVIDSSTNPSTVYAAHGNQFGETGNGVYKTTTNLPNTNASWTKVPGTAGSLFPTSSAAGTGAGRIRLSITRGFSPTTMYAIVHRIQNAGLLGVYKTTDGGATWTQTTGHPEAGLPANSFSICTQCWYNLNIAVYPTDPNVVYALATELFRSTNGGASWTLISNSYSGTPAKIHADQHGFDFMPGNSNGFYVGNDGGMYKSTDGGNTFTNLNDTLSITQFYRGAVHPANPNVAIGGSQDNGMLSYLGSQSWFRPHGGDGSYGAIDPENPNFVYGSSQFLNMTRSVNGPHGFFNPADADIPCNPVDDGCTGGENRQFIAPLLIDPHNSKQLYAGTTRVYRSTNSAATWSARSPDLSGSTNRFNAISAISVARSTPDVVYVGTGSSNAAASRVWVTTNATAAGLPTWMNRSAGLPNRTVASIGIHPTDPNTAYVAFSGFDTGHLFRTTNAGVTWTDVSGTLPNAPINAVIVDPANAQRLYVGTDVGVFKSTNGATTWESLNAGLPTVVINDLVLNLAGTRLTAFTHGRGAYVLERTGATGPGLTPSPTAVTNPTCGSVQATGVASGATPVPANAIKSAPAGATAPSPAAAARGGDLSRRPIHAAPAPASADNVGPATGPGWTTIVCETFEGPWPAGGWSTGSGHPANNFDWCWGTTTYQPYPGSTQSVWHDRACADGHNPATDFYRAFTDSWMVYGPFSLEGATAAEVHFQRWHQIKGSVGANGPVGDALYVQAFTPDTDLNGFYYTGNTTAIEPPTTQGWVPTTVNLASIPNLLGKPEVYVAWLFRSDSGNTTASLDDGAFIDDVLIHRFGNVPPSPTNTPTPFVAAPTATRTPTRTATPGQAAVAGRDFTLRAGPPGLASMSWRPGTQSTGEVIIRYSGTEGIRFLPANLVPLAANVTTFADSGPLPDEAYCYLEMSVGGNPPVVSNNTFMGFSDFLCIYPGGGSGNPPGNVSIALNQSRTATINFTQPPGGGQTGYRTTVIRFNGTPNEPFTTSDSTVTSFQHDTQGLSTCYRLEALNGATVMGTAKTLCAVPDIYAAVAGEEIDLQTAFERATTVLRQSGFPSSEATRSE